MNKTIGVLIGWLVGSVAILHAEQWTPPKALLDTIRRVESADGRFTVGDEGRSLGDYQFSEAAWLDVNTWRQARGRTVYSYNPHVWNTRISRIYAAEYLCILRSRLETRLKRTPTWAEIYAAYNMGFSSFGRCQYRLARSNPTTARKCLTVQAAVGGR
jgi:hypothetical protein